MKTAPVNCNGHRFPPHIIAHAVWLYYRFPLGLRMVEETLLERGTTVSYETIQRSVCVSRKTICQWVNRFGGHLALHSSGPDKVQQQVAPR